VTYTERREGLVKGREHGIREGHTTDLSFVEHMNKTSLLSKATRKAWYLGFKLQG
jgi:hypothetical protein